MTRVSEKSNTLSLKHAMNRTKHKMEELQLKGTTLKRINKPSDDPIGNVQVLAYSSKKSDNDQFIKNADFALLHLQYIENAIVELTEITNRAKELAIGQASDFYDGNIRSGVAKEIRELNRSALSIGNRRLGNRYIFAGHKTLTKPFDNNGNQVTDEKMWKALPWTVDTVKLRKNQGSYTRTDGSHADTFPSVDIDGKPHSSNDMASIVDEINKKLKVILKSI